MRAWTPKDDAVLRRLKAATDAELARILGRKTMAVRARRRKLARQRQSSPTALPLSSPAARQAQACAALREACVSADQAQTFAGVLRLLYARAPEVEEALRTYVEARRPPRVAAPPPAIRREPSAGALFAARAKQRIVDEDGPHCQACGVLCTPAVGRGRPDEASIDHIRPRSKGGSNRRENLQLLCRRCNEAKGDDTWE